MQVLTRGFLLYWKSLDFALFCPFSVRLWDFLEALEDERTGEEYAIIMLEDSDSDSDWKRNLATFTWSVTSVTQ